MARIPSSLVAASGLVGGFAIAQATKKRELGGVVLVAAGAVAATRWRRVAGPGTAIALTGLYFAACAGAHPLAKKLGAWPSVGAVTTGVALASWAAVDRRA